MIGDGEIPVTLEIVNEDGTSIYDRPVNPLKEKWDELYTVTMDGKPCRPILGYCDDGKPIMNYCCVLCNNKSCHYCISFIVPDEDKEVYEKYRKEVQRYNEIHNPSLTKKRRNK